MRNRRKSTVLSPRQRKFLFSVAEGASITAASAAVGYTREWGSEIACSDEFKREIAELQSLAARELILRLPLLTKVAIDELGKVLNGPFPAADKLRAAAIVAALASRCLDKVPAPDESVIELAREEPPPAELREAHE